MGVAVLIPAYRPGEALVRVVTPLAASGEITAIVVVDDGSGPAYAGIFDAVRRQPGVYLLRHAVNLGKGAALRMGMNFVLCELPDPTSVVTADADGQHHPDDILKIASRLASNPDALILGVRQFEGDIPFRSRFGNTATSLAFRYLVGEKLLDTQTGLRGVPNGFMPHLLKLTSRGYEFELDMLIMAKHRCWRIVQEPIRTIYEPGNPSSHFNPVLDSIRAYAVLLRFTGISVLTAILDNLVFYVAYTTCGSIAASQAAARIASIIFQYSALRATVFASRQKHRTVLPKFVAAVAMQGLVSYAIIRGLIGGAHMHLVIAKPLAEGLLFLIGFVVQRDWIFTRTRRVEAPGAAVRAAGGASR